MPEVTGGKPFASLLLALALAFAAGAAGAEPPVWIASTPKSKVVLFGSVHVLPPGLAWRPRQVDAALSGADQLWFEIPIDDATQAQAASLTRRRGLLPERQRLTDHLTPDGVARLERVAQTFNLPLESLQRMRPWLAEVTLSLMSDLRDGATASQGVEQQIAASTPHAAHLHAFETAAEQIGFLAGAPMSEQVASLMETLDEIETSPGLYRRLVEEWMAGDVKGLQTDALDPTFRASPGVYRRLITERNRRWARILGRRLKDGGTTVVVVGVAHLIGPGGVPALLRAQGFTVEGP